MIEEDGSRQAESIKVFSRVAVHNTNGPRDVATLLVSGYLVIVFLTDNSGAWLMHCHIGWHV
jgi:FtsP/CotA-like multicopper oxidase with cupredoxin domain